MWPRRLLLIIIYLATISNVCAITIINEIMYNPEGNDNNREFIEIFSDEISNFTNYSIEDLSGSKDFLNLIQYINSEYSLIVEDGFNYSGINASVYTVGATIGNNLNNDRDLIILRNPDNDIVDLVYYYSAWGGDGNKKSLERIDVNDFSSDSRNWIESIADGGTPGLVNRVLDENFNSIKLNEVLPDPFGDDDANMPDGEFVELYNNADEEINLGGFNLQDEFGHKINIDNSHTTTTIIKSKSYLTVYMNGFSGFLNNNEDEVKLFYNNILLDKFDYSNTKEGFSYAKVDNKWILTHPTPNEDNSKGVIINKSFIKILKYNKNAKFGDLIEVKLNLYKGDTIKNAVNLFIENEKYKISEEVNFNIFGKYVNYTINVPLQIYPNCDSKYEEGEYKLKVSGLGEDELEKIEISGNNNKLCKTKEIPKKESSSVETENTLEHVEETANKVTGNVIYESSDVKAKNYGTYIFIAGLMLIIIFLIFRKGL